MDKPPPTNPPSLTLIGGKSQTDESDEQMDKLASKVCVMLSEKIERLMVPVTELEAIRRKDYLSEREVSIFFSIPTATLQTDRCRGTGPRYMKDGRKILYAMEDLIDYFKKRLIQTRG